MSRESVLARRTWIGWASAAVAGIATGAFVLGRVLAWGPNRGDIAVWIPIHEWLARGASLYAGIWDHKDWGFFWLTQPFYLIWSVTGLYVAGTISAVLVGVGSLLLTSTLVRPLPAVLLSFVTTSTYVSATSFLSTYTENLAIGLASLGVGLMVRWRFWGGLLFALSISVKVAGILVLLLIVLVEVATQIRARRHDGWKLNVQPLLALGSGLVFGLLTVCVLALISGSLPGWLEIVSYNREYAQFRGAIPGGPLIELPGALVQNALHDFAWLERSQFMFLGSFFCGLAGLVLLWRPWLDRVPSETEVGSATSAVTLSSSFVLGALLVTLSQRPAWWHWQYVVAPLAVLLAVLWSAAKRSGRLSQSIRMIISVGLLALPLVVAIHFDRSLLTAGAPTKVAGWMHLNEGAVLGEQLGELDGAVIAVFGQNDRRIDYQALPSESTLACRFFYQYEHLLPRYRGEIEECKERAPNVVIVERADWGDENLRASIESWLRQEFIQCNLSLEEPYDFWALDSRFCPRV